MDKVGVDKDAQEEEHRVALEEEHRVVQEEEHRVVLHMAVADHNL